MRIAVDAMGGDYAPREIVAGAVQAARKLEGISRIYLMGDSAAIKRELSAVGRVPDKVEVRHASEVVAMDESPAQAVRRKKDSSIGRCVDMVKAKEADAVVSAGNTGAVVVASTLKLRTLPGVIRPGIAAVLPTQRGPMILIDAGATVEADAALLTQFGVMGSAYCQVILGRESPVVGLLNIGGEETRGNDITKEAFRLLSASNLNFKGNVEGRDIFEGNTDVVVCDGFVGNTVLKTSESVATAVVHWVKQEFRKNLVRLVGALLMAGAFKVMKGRMDPESHGGALLLGVNGVCIIGHGSSSAHATFHAIRVARESVHHHLNELITEQIARLDGRA